MSSLSTIPVLKKKYKLTDKELLKSMHKCIKYFLSEDELNNFFPKRKSKK